MYGALPSEVVPIVVRPVAWWHLVVQSGWRHRILRQRMQIVRMLVLGAQVGIILVYGIVVMIHEYGCRSGAIRERRQRRLIVVVRWWRRRWWRWRRIVQIGLCLMRIAAAVDIVAMTAALIVAKGALMRGAEIIQLLRLGASAGAQAQVVRCQTASDRRNGLRAQTIGVLLARCVQTFLQLFK